MSSRVRKGVIGGLLVVGVGLSGCLVACSDPGSSSSDGSASSTDSRTSRSSTRTTINAADEIDVHLTGESLNGKKSWDDRKRPFVRITGTIKNKTDKKLELSPDLDGFVFDCQYKPDVDWVSDDSKNMCGQDVSTTVTIPAHKTYTATADKGIFFVEDYLFNPDAFSEGDDSFRIKDGKKQFRVLLAEMNTKVSKHVSKEQAEVWVTMKGV